MNAGFDLGNWLATLSVAQRIKLIGGLVVLAVLVGILWLLWHILRQQGRLLLRIEAMESRLGEAGLADQVGSAVQIGLEIGTPAPPFRLASVQGETLTLTDLLAGGKPVLLLFGDPGCGPCASLFLEVGRWQRDYASKLTLAVISQGSLEANQSKASAHGIMRMLLQEEREVAAAYQVTGTPSAVLIGVAGTIGSRLAEGADAIRNLVASAIGLSVLQTVHLEADQSQRNGHGAMTVPRPPTGLKIGDAAPDFSLPDLSGNLVYLSDFRGQETLVLFWRPSCVFCQRMLADLKAWEAQKPAEAPRLLVVSTDSVADNQAMGLRSPVVLDQAGMSIGSTFGASGTPMAVLVDAEGRIVSELAAGAPAVLALARRGQEKTTPTR
jgi:peroxiredoxin